MSEGRRGESRVQPVAQLPATLIGSQYPDKCDGNSCDRTPSASLGGLSGSSMLTVLSASMRGAPAPWSCEQRLTISVFFDGTGNNLNADLPTWEHSNVAKLYRAAKLNDPVTGDFSIYVPGIGTLFPEIGDDGKGPIPFIDTHNGMGARGQDRLDWAFDRLAKIIHAAEQRALNPTNKILGIRLSVFGFSRGATLARAFVRDLVAPDGGKCRLEGNALRWKAGGYPLAIDFMGLWDTVASVGMPMSANNVGAVRRGRTMADGVRVALQMEQVPMLRAIDLAFGRPGADPAPGHSSGHGAWADGLAIPPMVGTCVQMIAAHEIRNSFPVDSLQRDVRGRPSNCKEYVYPGAHADVGGGYRPGEGARGRAAPMDTPRERLSDANLLLSLIPLKHMYDEARQAGVPLRRPGSPEWTKDNVDDFETSPVMCELHDHYMSVAGQGRPLGPTILAHTRLYLAWMFRRLRQSHDPENARLASNERLFDADRAKLDAEIDALDRARFQAFAEEQRLTSALNQRLAGLWQSPGGPAAARSIEAEYRPGIAAAHARATTATARMKELNARRDTLPTRGTLRAHIAENETQLLRDARSICAAIAANPSLRAQLRPHYRNIVETYEDEFVHRRGLSDEKIVSFFDNFVHDSLADFSSDCTLPSDPRVVFVGGDGKLDYARADEIEVRQAATV